MTFVFLINSPYFHIEQQKIKPVLRLRFCYLVQVDGSDLEPEDDDPQQTQDQRTVPVNHILWTNQIHPNLTGKTMIGLFTARPADHHQFKTVGANLQ